MAREVEVVEGETAVAGLQSKIASGIFWNIFQLFVDRGFGFVTKLILARLLLPEHFGIIGMAVVFTGLINTVNDLGMAAALIQFKKERLQRVHYNTAFWLSMLFSAAAFIFLLVVVGPFAAWFYGEPLLTLVIPAIGISVCLNPLNLVHRVQLTRQLNFKALGIVSSIASIGGGTGAIILALLGAGVWSIVAQSVIATLISVPLMWYTTKWWPSFELSRAGFYDIFSFSAYDLLSRIGVYLTKNVDYLLIGRLLGAEPLGFYTLAFTLTSVFRQQVMGILNKVMFPVYGQLQDELAAIKQYYLKVIKFNTIVLAPIMLIMIYYTQPLVHVLFGARWDTAVLPIQLMAFGTIIHAIGGTTDSVLKGIGRVDLNFKLNMVRTPLITIPAILIGTYFWGINGAAMAVVVNKVVTRFMYQYYMRNLINVMERDVFQAVKSSIYAFLATLPLAALAHYYVDLFNLLNLAAIVGVTGICFLLIVYICDREELQQTFHALRTKRKTALPLDEEVLPYQELK